MHIDASFSNPQSHPFSATFAVHQQVNIEKQRTADIKNHIYLSITQPKALERIVKTVHSCYLGAQGTIRSTSRYLYIDISDLQN